MTHPSHTPQAARSSGHMFIASIAVHRSRSGILHIPPPAPAELFPEAAPTLHGAIGMLIFGVMITTYWFLVTPSTAPLFAGW